MMAALVASDRPLDEVMQVTRAGFRVNPTGDFNWLPLASLIKGQRLRAAIKGSLDRLLGAQVDVEDLWKPFFCIATNYSQAHEQVLQRGSLAHVLLASTAIPGALPPVVHDGATAAPSTTFRSM
jgi:NTE family protein